MSATTVVNNANVAIDELEIIISRVIRAPRELVWEAWTDPRHVAQWFGPPVFTNPVVELDVRPGGLFLVVMRAPDGKDYPFRGTYIEVDAPNRLLYRTSIEGIPEGMVTVTFEDHGKGTLLTITTRCNSIADRDKLIQMQMAEGWTGSLETLESTMATNGFTITRTFDAPRDLVFQVWTDPAHLAKWFGPQGFTMTHCDVDLRPGGMFHYAMRAPNGGPEIWGKFVYREILRPEKLVLVTSFSNAAAGFERHFMNPRWPLEVLSTTTFSEQDGKTTLTMHSMPIHATDEEIAAFAGAHASMEGGYGGMFEQLAVYLKGL